MVFLQLASAAIMALVVDSDVDVIMTLLATLRLESVTVPLAELGYTVNDVRTYDCLTVKVMLL